MNIKVMKFGGTSMGTAQSMLKVAEIIHSTDSPKVVVVSATSGTTDQLLELSRLATMSEDFETNLSALRKKHEDIIGELNLGLNLSPFFEEIENLLTGIKLMKECSASATDRMLSFGEQMSGSILAALLEKQGLKAIFCDAYDLIFTDNSYGEGVVDMGKTTDFARAKLLPLVQQGIVPVVTGFIGQSSEGKYITLGRGGSDYSGGILASALDAVMLDIWTDVDGIFNADPRLIKEAGVLEQISFEEAGELAYFGAKVLHPKTVKPAISKNIPVRIANTFNPVAPGTLITNENNNTLKSVTYKKNIAIVNISSSGMLDAHGFLARIFEVFRLKEVVVDVVSTSEVSVSLTVKDGDEEKVIDGLEEFSQVSVQKNMAILCFVGNGISQNPRILERFFGCMNIYEISMISVGNLRRNITVLIPELQAPQAVKTIFQQFFNQSDNE